MGNIVIDALFYTLTYMTLFFSVLWILVFFLSPRAAIKRQAQRPLTIIVPAHNEEKNISSCIKSLVHQDYPGLKIIVVDDGSTDNTSGIAKSLCREYSSVRYIGKERGGKASALNTGLRHANTELFGFIDADTFLSKNALKNMAGYISGSTAAVIAAIKPYNPRNLIERIQNIEYVISSFTRKILTFVNSLYLTPGFSIYKTDVIRKLGGFDENNITEDLEIGLRLKNNGFSIDTSLEDSAYTKVPSSLGALYRQRLRWYRGYVYNTRKYSHILFNRKFGDFGVLVLPMNYLVMAIVIPFMLWSVYDSMAYMARRIADMFLVNFDISYLLSSSSLNLITPTTFFVIVTFMAFFLMLDLSKKHAKGDIRKLDYLVFIVVYPFINTFLWLCAFTYEALRIKRIW